MNAWILIAVAFACLWTWWQLMTFTFAHIDRWLDSRRIQPSAENGGNLAEGMDSFASR